MLLGRSAKNDPRISEICRLCLRESVGSSSIFSKSEASERLRLRILDCCPVTLIEDSETPNAICEGCEKKLAAAYEFREQCRRSERILRSRRRRQAGAPSGLFESDASRCGVVRDRGVLVAAAARDRPDAEESGRKDSETVRRKVADDHPAMVDASRCPKERETVEANSKVTGTDGDGDGVGASERYPCDACSKTFASKSGLRFHLKTHDGAKPHPCRYCGKAFAIPSYAKRHEKIHEGRKRFVCHVCSAAFASSNGLKYHLRSHTGEANYRCEICGKSFRRFKYLKEHAFTHTGEKPFVCKRCGSAYGNSGSLFVHEKKCEGREALAGREARRRPGSKDDPIGTIS